MERVIVTRPLGADVLDRPFELRCEWCGVYTRACFLELRCDALVCPACAESDERDDGRDDDDGRACHCNSGCMDCLAIPGMCL
jgi:hypothetical protein